MSVILKIENIFGRNVLGAKCAGANCWGWNVTEAKHPGDEMSPGRKTGGETSGSRNWLPKRFWINFYLFDITDRRTFTILLNSFQDIFKIFIWISGCWRQWNLSNYLLKSTKVQDTCYIFNWKARNFLLIKMMI